MTKRIGQHLKKNKKTSGLSVRLSGEKSHVFCTNLRANRQKHGPITRKANGPMNPQRLLRSSLRNSLFCTAIRHMVSCK